jgi:hypothetical protein
MSDATTSTAITTMMLGGKVIQSPGGEIEVVSWFQHAPERFKSFEVAEQWLLEKMDSEMTNVFDGVIRQLPGDKFVAVSQHQRDAAVCDTLTEAEEWLLDQRKNSIRWRTDW